MVLFLSFCRNRTNGHVGRHSHWSLLSLSVITRDGKTAFWTNNANVLWNNTPISDGTCGSPSITFAWSVTMARKYGTGSNKCPTCNSPFVHYSKWSRPFLYWLGKKVHKYAIMHAFKTKWCSFIKTWWFTTFVSFYCAR